MPPGNVSDNFDVDKKVGNKKGNFMAENTNFLVEKSEYRTFLQKKTKDRIF